MGVWTDLASLARHWSEVSPSMVFEDAWLVCIKVQKAMMFWGSRCEAAVHFVQPTVVIQPASHHVCHHPLLYPFQIYLTITTLVFDRMKSHVACGLSLLSSFVKLCEWSRRAIAHQSRCFRSASKIPQWNQRDQFGLNSLNVIKGITSV